MGDRSGLSAAAQAVDGTLRHFNDRPPAQAAVAVSGGSDSTALLVATAEVAAIYGFRAKAVTVNHGLRPEAAAEAQGVAALCGRLGVDHSIIEIDTIAPGPGIPARARAARYQALQSWALANDAPLVMVGHTADDVAHTFLMRLARGAGLKGLSRMQRDWQTGRVRFCRPILHLTREALRKDLRDRAIEWVDDPSNDDPAYARTQARDALSALAPLGLDVATISEAAARLAEADEGLNRATLALAQEASHVDAGGTAVIDLQKAAAWGDEMRRRLLLAYIGWIGQAAYAPRRSEQRELARAFPHHRIEARSRTLGGCLIRSDGAGRLHIIREAARAPEMPVVQDWREQALWDGRWEIKGPDRPQDRIGPLGRDGLLLCPKWRETGLSAETLSASPAIWRDGALVAAPVAAPEVGNSLGWSARIVADLPRWMVSH